MVTGTLDGAGPRSNSALSLPAIAEVQTQNGRHTSWRAERRWGTVPDLLHPQVPAFSVTSPNSEREEASANLPLVEKA